ncbi:MAG: exodeoxyribonuclease III [Pseudomonadota bacterium]|nr:exodeoxyribonuclease III [Pseudomonadota bacterium]
MKIASWNVNSLNVRLPQVLEWLTDNPVDVLGLQETKLPDERFPAEAIEAAGYQVVYAGQPTYNGVAVLTRAPVSDVITDLPGFEDPQRRLLACTVGDLRFINVYVPNGQEVGSDKYEYKLRWLEKFQSFLSGELSVHSRLAVVGDFNIAPEDRDVHDPDEWRGKVLCSDLERLALESLLKLGLVDSFRLFEQADNAFSWWDYRMNNYRRNRGLRIDLILLSETLAQSCTDSAIDAAVRGWERPSDHVPVVAELR